MHNRRKLVVGLGAGMLIAPSASFAQLQGKVWRVGFLSPRRRPDPIESDYIWGFPLGMRELGYIEGKNLVIEWRFADFKNEHLPSLAADLVQRKVDVIATNGTPATHAAQKATTTIPIVMMGITDPVSSGFVKSLARPDHNITGTSNLTGDLAPKLLELLRDLFPKLSRVAVLMNPDNSANVTMANRVQRLGQKIGVSILPVEARGTQEFENAFSMMKRQNVRAAIVLTDPLFNSQGRQIADLASLHQLPVIGANWALADAGFLMSYGHNPVESFRRAAVYVDKILKGAKPSDLPVEQPMRFDLVINMKAAKALGITFPKEIAVIANRVIE